MTISQALTLSEPTGSGLVPHSTLAYFRFRFKQRIFDAVLREFKRSGLTKADLARRLGKDPATISRLLSGPGNITLETVSDVLFATSGSELSANIEKPLSRLMTNVTYTDPLKPRTGTFRPGISGLRITASTGCASVGST